jgi:mono/diheme cytochrome c family protein
VLAFWVTAGAARAQVDPDRLAIQAREILRANCKACHGPGPDAKAGLNLEDRELLVGKRRLVLPGAAASSQLIDLVAGGSMPPGDRPGVPAKDVDVLRQWIDAGAPAAPAPGDDYVFRRIARDWKLDRPDAERPAVRYLSLNHLLRGKQAVERLAAARKELEQALTAHGRKAALAPIDPEESIFRVLLTDLGWERRPFSEFDVDNNDKRLRAAGLNLHDLVLLEYPYAYLTFSSPDFPALAGMMRQTKAIRPIPYLRGDWLAAALNGTPLGGEIASAIGRGARESAEAAPFFGAKVSLEEAAAEVSWKKGLPELQKALGEGGLEELGRGEATSRQAWEKAFPKVVERLGLGKAIVPLDALSVPDYRGDTDLEVRIETSDGKGRPKKRFKLKETLQVRVRPTRKAAVELVNTAVKGKVYTLLAPAKELAANRAQKLPIDDDAYTIFDDPGTEHLTVFAVAFRPEHLPGDLDSYPKGQLFRAEKVKGMRDRYVHSELYALRDDDKGFNSPVAAHMVKVTGGFEITRK